MSEVRTTQVAPAVPLVVPQVASATSSKRPEGVANLDAVANVNSPANTTGVESLPSSGTELPVKNAQANQETQSTSTIEQAVTEINDYVQSVQRDLHFSVDKDSGETIIRVRDKESGELIRQIPEDIFLSLAQNLKDNQPIHLFDAHG
jgi:flagellar protein FlaG